MGLNADWMQRDLNVLWHPCTQMKDHERLPVIPIRRGEGVWLEDFEGKRYIDAVSSWWVNVFGHANPRINQRIKDQVDQLEHVILAGFSHQPVIEPVGATGEDHPAGARPSVLRRQRLGGHRGRAEDELPLLAQ